MSVLPIFRLYFHDHFNPVNIVHLTTRILIIVLSISLFISCEIKFGKDKEESEPPAAVPVTVNVVSQGDISTYLRLNSLLQANREIEIFSRSVGRVTELNVEEGDNVLQGDSLTKLEDNEQKLAVERAAATVKREQVALERLERLHSHEQRMVSDDDYEIAKLALHQAELGLQEAELALEYTLIRAPFSGTITERLIDLGDRVDLSRPLFKLVDHHTLRVDTWIAEADVSYLSIGQNAALIPSGNSPDTLTARLIRLSPVVDQVYGKIKATFELRNRKGNVRPGQFVELSLVLDTHRNSIIIPKRALVHEAGKPTVYLVQDTLSHRRKVTTGIETGDVIEILSGLSVGDSVIVEGQATLRDSTHIQVIQPLQ